MHYKTCETLLLISSHLHSKYIFDLVYLTSEKENPFFNKNSHRQRHFSGNLNGLNTLLQGGRAAPLFQTCTSTSRKVCMQRGSMPQRFMPWLQKCKQSVLPKATTSNAVLAQKKVQLQTQTRFTMFIGRTAKAAKSAFLLVFH